MTEKLANLSWQSVLFIVAALLILRYSLLKLEVPFAKSVAEVAESLAVAMALVFFLIRPFLVQAFFIPSGSMHPTLLEDDHILVNKLGYRLFSPSHGDIVVFRAPGAWDQGGSEEKDYIKRLIGLPGDTIEVRSARLMAGAQFISRSEIEGYLIQRNIASIDAPEIRCKYLKDGLQVGGKIIPKKEVASWLGIDEKDLKIVPGQTIRNGKALDEPYTFEDPDYDFPKTKIPEGKVFVMGDNRNNSNDSHRNGPLERSRLLGKAKFIFWPISRIRILS